jgi:hypothetical protein
MQTFYYKMKAFNLENNKGKTFVYKTKYYTRLQFLADLSEWSRLSMLTHRTIYTYCEISKTEYDYLKE